ncbi:MAG: Brp/Blh family beta-carotene 15,15'-dioxygenase [Cryomorphaceae bacterium]
MSKEIYIFIASVLLMLPVLSLFEAVPMATQLVVSAPFIFLLGIPHGAIDNMLYLRENRSKNKQFIIVYVAIIAANVVLWLVYPSAAYALFLVLSAYHFGQSQFSHYFKSQNLIRKALFLAWGVSILSALILFNIQEINKVMIDYQEFLVFDPIHNIPVLWTIFAVSTLATIGGLLYFKYSGAISFDTIVMESLILGLILFSFYLMPLIIGFTLYFIILHSVKVLNEEYHFLQSENKIKSASGFIKLLLPFSLLSFLGIGMLFLTIHLEWLSISYGYCMLILISSITLPHVFVMNQFYRWLLRPGSRQLT